MFHVCVGGGGGGEWVSVAAPFTPQGNVFVVGPLFLCVIHRLRI